MSAMYNHSNYTIAVAGDLTFSLGRSVLFGLFLALFIPSVLCSVFIFIQFARKRTLYIRISNHIILIVLACSCLQVSS